MSLVDKNSIPSSHLHVPVLINEVLDMYSQFEGEPRHFLDGTFGRGGHTKTILDTYASVRATGIDQDEGALNYGREQLASYISAGRLNLIHNSYYGHIKTSSETYDLILLDLGVSSPQLDEAERGFSFYHEGPLDMRMNRAQEVTAADIVNTWGEEDLIEVFQKYGEVRSPYKIVKAILMDRKKKPFETTIDLASMIERVDGWKRKGKHPATQYFLGLRLVVNQELEQTSSCLPLMVDSLNPGGVFIVLSFHSLEDRIVKRFFKDADKVQSLGRRLNNKVIIATDDEQKQNPRSRSAKLRAFQKGRI